MTAGALLAAAVYLVPVAVVLVVRGRADRSIWEVAADIPLAVAADLLLVLLVSRFLRLDLAALASRGVWIAGGLLSVLRRARRADRSRWPALVTRAALIQATGLALLGLYVSFRLSRSCAIWDREWHIPLVSSLRGQRFPFANVYEPSGGLFYHFTGDVLAAMLQAFSGNALHASLALSLAHDLIFALLGAQIGLVLWAGGLRRLTLAIPTLVAVLLAGPLTLAREPARKLESGYSIVNFLSLSFRPHVSLAYLFTVGVLTFVLAGVLRDRPEITPRRLLPSLVLIVAALALTDESSLVLLMGGLGVLWLFDPGVLGVDCRRGALVLLALAATIALTALVFEGAVGPRAPHYGLTIVAPRSPGFLNPPVSLATREGVRYLVHDLWSVLLVGLAGLAMVWRGGPRLRKIVLFYGAILAASMLGFCCLELNHLPIESHRWVTAPFVLAPLVAAIVLVELARECPRGAAAAGLPALLVYVGCGLGVASTVEWLSSGLAERECLRHRNFDGFAVDRFYEVSCRAMAGAELGEKTRVTYAESTGAYLYSGCRPTFIAGPPTTLHKIKVGRPSFGREAMSDIHRNMLPVTEPLLVACLSGQTSTDPVCAGARALGRCGPGGGAFDGCTLSGTDRAGLLGGPAATTGR